MGKRVKEDCYTKAIKTIEKYKLIEEGDKLVVGVSGGPDSMCLVEILTKLKKQINQSCQKGTSPLSHSLEEKQINQSCQKGTSPLSQSCQKGTSLLSHFDFVVAHVNHMIRQEAVEDEIYVKKYCEKNNIQFFAKSIDVLKIANNNKISTEEAGRNARYEFFDEILEKIDGNKVAIAHNKNDSVETIIMNEFRGCGISGLKGIEPIRGKYIRPLIECERKEIEEYCKINKLQPRIDKTNFENIYTRNKIRNELIPYIQKTFNPNIIETIDRLSKLVIEQEEYVQKQVKIEYKKALLEENNNSITIDLKTFNEQEKVIKSNMILYIITRLFGTTKGIEKIHIEDIIKLCNNNVGNKYLTPNKNTKVFIKNSKITFIKQK